MTAEEFNKLNEIIIDKEQNVRLVKADPKEFGVYAELYINAEFSTFESINGQPLFTNKYLNEESNEYNDSYTHWITRNGHRIGGVIIHPYYAENFFLIPPYLNLKEFLGYLKETLHLISGGKNQSLLANVYGEHQHYLLEAGFKQKQLKLFRNSNEDKSEWKDVFYYMMRPTEKFEVDWDDDYIIVAPERKHLNDVTELNISIFPEDHEDTLKREAQDYFEDYENCAISKNAALLVYDKKNNKLIASIMAYIWKETPNIEALAVKKEHRGKGIGKKLMKHTLNAFYESRYKAVKLCVFRDNYPAVKMYEKLGFVKGLPIAKMIV